MTCLNSNLSTKYRCACKERQRERKGDRERENDETVRLQIISPVDKDLNFPLSGGIIFWTAPVKGLTIFEDGVSCRDTCTLFYFFLFVSFSFAESLLYINRDWNIASSWIQSRKNRIDFELVCEEVERSERLLHSVS